MGRKRYDDDALRVRALELRREGLSYREIARRLGCSTYKVWELLSSQENMQSTTKRIEELARRLDELSTHVREIEEKISMYKVLKDLADLASRVEEIEKLLKRIAEENDVAQMSALYKAFENPCRWIKENYCTLRYFHKDMIEENWVVKEDIVKGEVVYRLNVIEHPWLCLGCPFYQPTKTGYQGE
jgi:predicted transcriptional regulator